MKTRYLSHLWRVLLVLTACIDPTVSQGVTMNRFPASTAKPARTITVEKMTISWHFIDDTLAVTATAPTRGWVAVGFNQRNNIVGTNLIMGAVWRDPNGAEAIVNIEDQFVVRSGEHLPVVDLGSASALTAVGGEETGEQTTIHFRLPIKAVDPYHFSLQPGTTLYLIAAYSVDDDFAHHSRMRQHIRIRL